MKSPTPSLLALTLLATLGFSRAQSRNEVRKAETFQPALAADNSDTAPRPSENYKVRANDVLDVKVYQELDLSGRVQVREDGTVRLPLINETVRVGGLSVTEIENRIRALLARDYVRDPRVTVNIGEFSKITFTVMGQVNRAGTYPMPGNKSVTLLQAIGMAGSYTRLANERKVYLKRTVGNQQKVYVVDAQEMARNPKSDMILRDGDVIDIQEKRF